MPHLIHWASKPPYSIIGFEGRVSETQTPALRSPLLEDSTGRIFVVNQRDSTGVRIVPMLSSQDPMLGGVWTRIVSTPAEVTFVCLVLGPNDLAVLANAEIFCERTAKAVESTIHPRFWERLQVWICTEDEATVTVDEIAEQASIAVQEALNRNDRSVIYDAAWWLSRAARHVNDVELAIRALARHDPGAAGTLRNATSVAGRNVLTR